MTATVQSPDITGRITGRLRPLTAGLMNRDQAQDLSEAVQTLIHEEAAAATATTVSATAAAALSDGSDPDYDRGILTLTSHLLGRPVDIVNLADLEQCLRARRDIADLRPSQAAAIAAAVEASFAAAFDDDAEALEQAYLATGMLRRCAACGWNIPVDEPGACEGCGAECQGEVTVDDDDDADETETGGSIYAGKMTGAAKALGYGKYPATWTGIQHSSGGVLHVDNGQAAFVPSDNIGEQAG